MMYTDSHAHLDHSRFEEDREDVLERAARAGVDRVLTIGCLGRDPETAGEVLTLLSRQEGLLAAFGVHPHDACFYDPALAAQLEQLMSHPAVVGWGEIGLDYFYDHAPREVQKKVFREQLQRARRLGVPVIIHSRDAEEDTCRILEEEFSGNGAPAGVMHCFAAGRETARRCIELGFYISFSGMLTFKRSDDLREIAAAVPLERLLIETDSPYLAPVPFRGKRNEPAYVIRVAETLAQLRGVTPMELADLTSENFNRLFKVSSGS